MVQWVREKQRGGNIWIVSLKLNKFNISHVKERNTFPRDQ